jgi:hypothetical protein
MRAAKVDTIQPAVVEALRKAGASVQVLSSVGKGVPDLLVGYKMLNILLEVKSPGGALTPVQRVWHANWLGDIHVVYSPEDAVSTIYEVAHAYGY